MIANSGHDEFGRYTGGAAGDQTGGEWTLRSWYSRPWDCVLRHPNGKARQLIADLAVEAANNDCIGYDQGNRDSFWTALVQAGYRPAQIRTNCEADCSAGVIAITKAVGYLLGIAQLQNLRATYTGDMKEGYKAAGFTVLSEERYLASDEYLLPGDILLREGKHTAIQISVGVKADDDMWKDEEEHKEWIRQMYVDYLHREPSAAELARDMPKTLKELVYKLRTSEEGRTDWTVGCYLKYLSRSPKADELKTWLEAMIQRGASRLTVLSRIRRSEEAKGRTDHGHSRREIS